MKKIAFLSVLTASIIAATAPASAVIVAGSLTGGNFLTAGGSFVKTNPTLSPAVGVGSTNTANVFGMDESQGATLTAATRLWHTVALADGIGFTDIGAGTKVNSHLIWIDSPVDPSPGTANGTVTFGSKILGYRFSTSAMNATTALLGRDGVTYGALAPLESSNDVLSFSGRTLTYNFTSVNITGDYVRVITAVPEPTTWAMLIAGFSLVGLAARGRRRAVAA